MKTSSLAGVNIGLLMAGAGAILLFAVCGALHETRTVSAAAPAPLEEEAKAFLAALRPEQRVKARFPFADQERLNWHFVPKERKGLSLGEMDAAQRRVALRLLAASLSNTGYRKAETIRALEPVLKEIEGNRPNSNRDPDRYFFSIFGEPAAKGVWGLRYEGHHTALNWTILNGKVIASSPQFFGANPARVASGPQEGTRALPEEEDLGRAFARSLSGDAWQKALVMGAAPNDILTGARLKISALDDVGVAYRDLDAKQKDLLLGLIREHAAAQPEAVAGERLAAIRKAGLDDVKFVWMGSLEPGEKHYYRIQGKTFLIEYDNTQNRANHIHAVWRDFTGDFGDDILTEHYKQFPPGSAQGSDHGHSYDHSQGADHTHSPEVNS